MGIARILQAALIILMAEPCLASDIGSQPVSRLHRFVGAIEGTGETLVGSVFIDYQHPEPLPQFTFSISTGVKCSGELSWSKFGRPVEGAFSCSDGRTAQFWWSIGCYNYFLSGGGEIAGRQFRFEEELSSPCKAWDGWLLFRTPPNPT
jgi:hypothetical protein